QKKFFHFDRALESVARVTLAEHVALRHTPTDQVVAGDPVLVLGGREWVDMAAGHNYRLRANVIEPPGLVEPAKHGFVDAGKWDESLGGNGASRQDNDGIVGLDLGGIDGGRIARFERITKDVATSPAMEHDDQTKGDEEEFSCPAPAPKDQYGQEHEHPRQRRQNECFDELLKDKHAPLIAQIPRPKVGRGIQDVTKRMRPY